MGATGAILGSASVRSGVRQGVRKGVQSWGAVGVADLRRERITSAYMAHEIFKLGLCICALEKIRLWPCKSSWQRVHLHGSLVENR